MKKEAGSDLEICPLTPDRWRDLVSLFGERGACGGCWCMWWRLPRSRFEAQKGAPNRAAFRRIVSSGREPGLLAYRGDRPVGWCAVEPRDRYPALGRSRVLAPVDDLPVWSVTCLFIERSHRRSGVSVALLRAAVDHALAHGATTVEGYPVVPRKGAIPDAFAWTGTLAAFERAGFREVARRSPTRPIVRASTGARPRGK